MERFRRKAETLYRPSRSAMKMPPSTSASATAW
jgi:hypothetical protein